MVLLKPMYEVTVFLQGEKYETVSVVYPMLRHMISRLEKMPPFELEVLTSMRTTIMANLTQRWARHEDEYLLCCIIDPRSKDLLFPFVTPDIRQVTQSLLMCLLASDSESDMIALRLR